MIDQEIEYEKLYEDLEPLLKELKKLIRDL